MPASTFRTLVVGTRTSRLALWQTNYVIQLLQASWPSLHFQVEHFMTQGDRRLNQPLPEIGGKGLFTAELESALRQGEIDIAVHSLKDLPVADAPGLTLGAIIGRADVRDSLVARRGQTLERLPEGAVIGTSSLRRQAQLLAVRPDLNIRSIRGNVDTRIRKVMDGLYDATVLATAGLERLGLDQAISECLPLELMLPAPGQGALAVQCRAGDRATQKLLAAVDDMAVRMAVTAERAFLEQLGGGCSAPVAAYASIDEEKRAGMLHMIGMVASPDGRHVIRVEGWGRDGRTLGVELALQAEQQGARHLLRKKQSSLPLKGKRVVVTRSRHQAPELCRLLVQLGADPIVLPAIRIVPISGSTALERALQALDSYHWIVFTSVNGVEIFWQRLTEYPVAGLSRIAAVGPATARALIDRGVQPDFVPDEFVGEAIAVGLGDIRGRRILLLRAEMGRPNLAGLLAEQGAFVDDVAIYRTLPEVLDEAGVVQLRQGVDVITFTSGSSVRNFWATLPDRSLLDNVLVACIGPVTADIARKLGLAVTIVPTTYTLEDLVWALVEYFSSDKEEWK